MNEVVITVVATALVAVVSGLLIAFSRAMAEKDKLHAAELTRKDQSCATEVKRLTEAADLYKKDLIEQRLYAAEVEKRNIDLELQIDAWQAVARTLRDKVSMLQTTLDNNNIPIPSDRRNVTRPLGELLADELKNAKPPGLLPRITGE